MKIYICCERSWFLSGLDSWSRLQNKNWWNWSSSSIVEVQFNLILVVTLLYG